MHIYATVLEIVNLPADKSTITLKGDSGKFSLTGATEDVAGLVVGNPVRIILRQLPMVNSLTPATGAAAGGTAVTLAGVGFTGAMEVDFGGTAATGITVVSDTEIICATPAHAAGVVAVSVKTPAGTPQKLKNFTFA
jgi:hypothetical protein